MKFNAHLYEILFVSNNFMYFSLCFRPLDATNTFKHQNVALESDHHTKKVFYLQNFLSDAID